MGMEILRPKNRALKIAVGLSVVAAAFIVGTDVGTPTEAAAASNTLRITTANMDFNKSGDADYKKHLRKKNGVLCQQELGKGKESVNVFGVGFNLSNKKLLKNGDVGAHSHIRAATTKIGDKKVRVFSIHGLHKKSIESTGNKGADDEYFKILNKRLKKLTDKGKLWVVCGDFNRGYNKVKNNIGGSKAVGKGVDGIVVSKGLDVSLTKVDKTPLNKKWSDHPAIVAKITLK